MSEVPQTIRYDFKAVSTRYGDKIAMYSIIDGYTEDGFSVDVGNGLNSADQPLAYYEEMNSLSL